MNLISKIHILFYHLFFIWVSFQLQQLWLTSFASLQFLFSGVCSCSCRSAWNDDGSTLYNSKVFCPSCGWSLYMRHMLASCFDNITLQRSMQKINWISRAFCHRRRFFKSNSARHKAGSSSLDNICYIANNVCVSQKKSFGAASRMCAYRHAYLPVVKLRFPSRSPREMRKLHYLE